MSGRYRNPLGDEAPAGFTGTGPADDGVPDFSMMGSGLFGGSSYVPTPKERHAYINGVEIRAKYVGSIEVPEPRGDVMLNTAISRVRSQHKLSKENKPKMRFVISTTGIRVYDEATQLIRDTHPLERISYIMVLHSNRKVFSFVTANDPRTSSERVFTAHVFKTNKKTLKIKELVGRCFSLAVELQRQTAPSTSVFSAVSSSSSSSSVAPITPANPDDQHYAYAQAAPVAPSSSSDFGKVVKDLVAQVQGLHVGAIEKQRLIEGVMALDSIHTATVKRTSALQAENTVVKRTLGETKLKWQKTLTVASDLSARLSSERAASGKGEIQAARRLSLQTSTLRTASNSSDARSRSSTIGGGGGGGSYA